MADGEELKVNIAPEIYVERFNEKSGNPKEKENRISICASGSIKSSEEGPNRHTSNPSRYFSNLVVDNGRCCATHSNGFGHITRAQIDENWNVDVNDHYLVLELDSRDSQFWRNLHPKDLFEQEKNDKIQTTSRPDDIWPEVWSKMSLKHSTNKTKQQWKKENSKLNAARELRGNLLHCSG